MKRHGAFKSMKLDEENIRASFQDGVSAAFSAAVFARYYGTETTASDLRREFRFCLQETVRLPQA